jgi:hypothetical protein
LFVHQQFSFVRLGCLSFFLLAIIACTQGDPIPDGNTSDTELEERIKSVTWDGDTFEPQNLGAKTVQETTAFKVKRNPHSIAFLQNGDMLGTYGGGSTPNMGMKKWSAGVESDFVAFQFRKTLPDGFQNPDANQQRENDETRGAFWFFDGILAISAKDQIYFNLGSCGPNGVYQLLATAPIKVEREVSTDAAQALQFYPTGSEDLYMTGPMGLGRCSRPNPPHPIRSHSSFASTRTVSRWDTRSLSTRIISQQH